MTQALACAPSVDDTALVQTRVLVISDLPGMAEMVARNVGRGDPALVVRSERMTLADLCDRGPLTDTDLVIFGIRPGQDADVAALRRMKADDSSAIKFLGLTAEPLSLAVARGLMAAGLDEVMPLAAAAPRLTDAAQIAPVAEVTQAKRGDAAHNGLIVAVAAARGGLGATAFALNAATLMAQTDRKSARAGTAAPRIAVVDLDFQNGVLGSSLDITDGGGYLTMLQTGQHPDHEMLQRAMVSHPLGFDVMAAPDAMAPLDAMTPDMVAVLLDELRLAYDVVILDLPRALTDWTAPVLARADRLFLLTDPTVHTVRQTRRMMDMFRDDNPSLTIDLVVTHQRKPFSQPAHVKEAERFLGESLRHWLPGDARAAQRAAGQGVPLAAAAPRSATIRAMGPLIAGLRTSLSQTQRRRA
ncbi:AAA family ATPase [Loktanella sp. M215]|uniref:AAA family ATPase n=1 Tax=Loktanella sp. M215 TaxID=2675431 RepID=UPI001F3C00C8|nr:hypothetical protein [Loktanella sp. M215]MCF7699481.1 hypothetical protein [Loktanella sp. M215]